MHVNVVTACPDCGTQLAPGLLVCPACHRLVHAERLKALAAEATAAREAGNVSESVRLWREVLDLLPPGTQQHAAVAGTVAELSRQIDVAPAPPKSHPFSKATGIAGAT